MLTTGQDIEREKSNFRTPFFLFFLRSCVFTPFVRRSEPRSTQKRTHTFFWCCYWRRWTWRISVLSFLSCFFFFSIVFGLHSKFESNLWFLCFIFVWSFGEMPMRNSLDSHLKHSAACGAITIECKKLHSLAIWACARASSAVDQSELELKR